MVLRSGLSEAASRIENATSWNDAEQQTNEHGDDDDEHGEEDVGWYTGDCDDELDETAHTVGAPTDDPVILTQFDGNLEDAEVSATQVHASTSQATVFQEARELLSRVESARGYFPVVGICAFDNLAQPSTDRKPAKSRGKGKKGKRKGKSSSQKSGKPTNLCTPGILPKPQTSRSESRSPMSKKRPTEVGATCVGPHHAPHLRPDQCMLCRQVGHRASECHNKRKATAFSPRAFGTCAVFDAPCCGATVEETEQDQDENDIENFVAFSNERLEGVAILDGGATKTISGFMSIQPTADPNEDTTIETTDVGNTFAGGETEAANTNIWTPHAEFPHGISVNAVSNESTPFLVGLDVIREYGLVIDCHYNRVYSYILKRYLPCALLPTLHFSLAMMPNNSEQRQVSSQALSTLRWGPLSQAQERGTLSFESSMFHLHEEESEHEHEHSSTNEDDLWKLLGVHEETQTWTRFDKRAKSCRTTSSSGPLSENVIARITIDDRTGHNLEHTKKHEPERFASEFALCSRHSHVASSPVPFGSAIDTVVPNVRCTTC